MAKKQHSYKCELCKELIPVDEEIVIQRQKHKKDGTTEDYTIKLHKHCAEEYEARIEEYKEWDELYQYVRHEIMQYDKQQLTPHQRNRLQGLKIGEYGNKVGNKIALNVNGYPYKIILLTFKALKFDILKINNSKFNDENGKFNYILAMVMNMLPIIDNRLKQKEKAKEEIENKNLDSFMNTEADYKKKTEDNKVADKLKDLW